MSNPLSGKTDVVPTKQTGQSTRRHCLRQEHRFKKALSGHNSGGAHQADGVKAQVAIVCNRSTGKKPMSATGAEVRKLCLHQ